MSIPTAKKDSFETLQKENQALRNQNVALLGDGEVFIRRDASGVMRACKMPVSLSERNKEIQRIGEHWMITSAGADKLNQLPGLNIMTPPPSSSTEKKFPTPTSNGIRRRGRSSRFMSGRSSSVRTRSGIWSASITPSFSTSILTSFKTFR
ncbi:MAG: hypothetical protein MPW14_11010 [Candidatus Manganitrophus sp.]|nr:hypothetical protein [Candidatus Manganitrophus sp.]WDT70542.1 MAG: hypothetical protein MPW17_17580 [Candidatus Manganitrophus sp.]WDT82206.1 MAG: hypothetical protein MPW14_11010 [Candidatus Manganitrophus sp.]